MTSLGSFKVKLFKTHWSGLLHKDQSGLLERSMSLIQEEMAILTTGPQQQDDTRDNGDNEQVNTENGQ